MKHLFNVEDYDYAYLRVSKEDLIGRKNPLAELTQTEKDNFHYYTLYLLSQPKYFHTTVKVLLGIDLLPEQVAILQLLWKHSFPMYIASRGFGKSFLLAVYCVLKCILVPGTKIVIVGSAFRQSKVIFEYMDTIWKNAPILRSICSDNSGPKRDIDRCLMKINDSWAMAVPLGDGTKIRGLRAHTIIADEFNCLEKNTIVETKNGLIRIGDEIDPSNIEILTGDETCEYEKPDTYVTTQKVDAYEVVLENGYKIICSENHQLMTNSGWKIISQLTTNDYIESDNKYKFPKNGPVGDKELSWLLGILVSEGSVVNKTRISVKTTDYNLALKLNKQFGFKIHCRSSYIDKRGWDCKASYEVYLDDKNFRSNLYGFGLEYVKAIDKKIPKLILQESEECVISFLEGLFEGDGSCFLFSSNEVDNRLGLAYYSASERLCRDVQVLINKLGYDSYINNRKSEISDNLQWFVRLNGRDAYSLASRFNIERFKNPIENAHIPVIPKNYTFDKSRNKWKTNIVHCGNKIQKRFDNLSELKIFLNSLVKYKKVKHVRKIDKQMVLYDYHLPKTHSFYAGCVRNHNSIPVEIYETVVAGFTAVSAKPSDNVKKAFRRKKMQEEGKWSEEQEEEYEQRQQNQSILSGTCGYDFEPFADYWRKYKKAITEGTQTYAEDKLDKLKSEESEEESNVEMPDYMKKLNKKAFCVIRIPYELIPEGFMDDQQVSRARATMHNGIYQMEYGAVFTSDSQGFFRRKMIESATAHERNIKKQNWPSYCPDTFDVVTRGNPNMKYVFGIDPASERDKFSIVVLELHPEHQRLVYVWSTNKKDFRERMKLGLTDLSNYNKFCVRKIRELMRVFPCVAIGIDSQGGGFQIAEGLMEEDWIMTGERKVLEVIDEKREKPTDMMEGDHILHLVNFADAKWTSQANHALRRDIESKALLFPRFDTVTLALMNEKDKLLFNQLKNKVGENEALRLYDTLEDCVMEVEDLKSELTTVVVTRTASGREKFDTPEIKLDTGKKGRMRKDRYSALVIANDLARAEYRELDTPVYVNVGRIIDGNAARNNSEGPKKLYNVSWAPDWNTNVCRMVTKQ